MVAVADLPVIDKGQRTGWHNYSISYTNLKTNTMNQEQNDTGNNGETNTAAGNEPVATGGAANANGDANPQDDYYAVDHAKKDVISTIGDGEMHDEGLVGAGEVHGDIESSMDQLTDEQDAAEAQDSDK